MSLTQETARRGITINSVTPGSITTDMTAAVPLEVMEKVLARIPVGRLGTAYEVARVVEFLADPQPSYITEQVYASTAASNVASPCIRLRAYHRGLHTGLLPFDGGGERHLPDSAAQVNRPGMSRCDLVVFRQAHLPLTAAPGWPERQESIDEAFVDRGADRVQC
jgi:hypothetical protein